MLCYSSSLYLSVSLSLCLSVFLSLCLMLCERSVIAVFGPSVAIRVSTYPGPEAGLLTPLLLVLLQWWEGTLKVFEIPAEATRDWGLRFKIKLSRFPPRRPKGFACESKLASAFNIESGWR